MDRLIGGWWGWGRGSAHAEVKTVQRILGPTVSEAKCSLISSWLKTDKKPINEREAHVVREAYNELFVKSDDAEQGLARKIWAHQLTGDHAGAADMLTYHIRRAAGESDWESAKDKWAGVLFSGVNKASQDEARGAKAV